MAAPDDAKPMFVAGEWLHAVRRTTLPVSDPATGAEFARIAYGDTADCAAAIEAASDSLDSWGRRAPHARAKSLTSMAAWLRDHIDRLAGTTTRESGKPLRESKGEWSVAADLFEYYAAIASSSEGRVVESRLPGRTLQVTPKPIGVVGVITAWNFPAYNPARAVAAALAAGCTVVLRPAELTPLSGLAFAEAADATECPAGVLNVVLGEPAPMAQEMLSDPRCRKLSFTGSTRVGKELIAGSASTVTSLSLELGGNAPVLVSEDHVRQIGIRKFAKAAVTARFRNCGQVCIAPQRFYVEGGVYDELCAALAESIGRLRVGPGSDLNTEIGPLISEGQRDRVEQLLAKPHGGRVLAGGQRPASQTSGSFFAPTLVADVDRNSPLWTEETFGPVLTVSPFDDIDDAIADANRLEAGLAAYAFAHDTARRRRLAEQLEFGMVAINGWIPHANEAPFPGWKQSGLGAESGPEGLREYQQLKVISDFCD